MPRQIYTVYNPKPFEFAGVHRRYTWEYVERMEAMLDKYCPGSNLNVIESVFPGWWGKIEVFKHSPVFYMDLSVVLIDNITHLVDYPHRFTALRDFSHPDLLNSKVMAWNKDLSHIYKGFKWNADEVMEKYKGNKNFWGDQSYIDHNIGQRDYFQDIFPNEIVSYKRDEVSRDTKIIGFHGHPKPHETEYWNEI